MTALSATPLRKRTSWEIQRAVLFALVLREFRTKIGRHWTGIIWTVFEPLAHVLVILAIFGYLRNISSPVMEFPIFLISGMMPYFLFRDLSKRLTGSFESNRGLFAYRQVKPLDTVVGRAIVECLTWMAVFVFTLAMFEWAGLHALPAQPLELFGVAALTAILGGALGLWLAVVTNGRPRLRTMIGWIYTPLYITSGVIFHIDRLPENYVYWLSWNPMLHIVDLSRNAFEPRYPLHAGMGWSYPASFTLVLLALALALYRRDRQKLLMER